MLANRRSWLSGFVVAALALALSFAGAVFDAKPALAGTMTNQPASAGLIGGGGGEWSGDLTCPVGSVATGIRTATSGNAVSLGMECKNILASGELGTTATRSSGGGGVLHECPAGKAVVGAFTRNSNSPQNVGVICQSPPNKLDVEVEVGPTVGNQRAVNCAANGFVNRLNYRWGAWFDGFSVYCVSLNDYPSAVVKTADGPPTGAAVLNSTLTTGSAFVGFPAPAISYDWQISDDGATGWVSIQGQSSSTLLLSSASYLGKYVRLVSVGSNTIPSGPTSQTATTAAVGPIALPAPSTPDLSSISDSGTDATDNVTNDTTPTVSVSNLVVGADLTITATKNAVTKICVIASVGNTTTSCTFDTAANPASTPPVVSNILSDGTWSLAATQTLGGQSIASASALSNLVIDTVAPTAVSVAITPSLTVAKTVSVTTTFSEAVSAHDTTKFLIVQSSTPFTKSNYVRSGSSVSFDITYAALTIDDVLISVNSGAATDVAGNLQSAGASFNKTVNIVSPTANFDASPIYIGITPTSKNATLTFSRDVWGLASSDLTWSPNTAACSTGTIVPSAGPENIYTIPVTCTGTGTSTLTLAANSVRDQFATTGPATTTVLSVIRDTTAPTISTVSSTVVGTRIDYTVSFSEAILTFPASAIAADASSTSNGTGSWVATTPVRVGSTNNWTFSVNNANAANGTYKPDFNNTAGITDLAGNALTANPTITAANVEVLPSMVIGALGSLGTSATALAPNFELNLYGGKLYGIRITSSSTSGSGDSLSVSLSDSNMGNSLTRRSGSSNNSAYLEIIAANATEAQWRAAIRAVQFDAGSASGTRSFEFHLRPRLLYSWDTSHYYERGIQGNNDAALADAAASNFYGMQGYLTMVTSQVEQDLIATENTNIWLNGTDAAVEGTYRYQAGPEDGNLMSMAFWDALPTPQPDGGTTRNCIFNRYDSSGVLSNWWAAACGASYWTLIEYGGMPGDPAVPSMKANASTTVDAVAPFVVRVSSSSANGTYLVGETIDLTVTMNEATVVNTGGGTPRIALNVSNAGSTMRYANYIGGSGTTSLTFRYTVQAGDSASDLNYAATNSLLANNGTVKDAAGNDATLTLPATNSASLSLAGTSAVVVNADLFIPATFSLGTLPAIGPNVISVAPNFALTVRREVPTGIKITNLGFNSGASVPDSFSTGTLPSAITLVTNANGVIELSGPTATQAEWQSAIRAITLDAGSDNVDRSLQFHLNPGNNYDYATATPANIAVANYVGDLTGPTVTNVAAGTANGTYLAGDTVTVLVTFSEAISVTGTPQLDLNLGANTRTADCVANPNSSAQLLCSYVIAQGDTAADLNYSGTSALSLNGGSIADAPGNSATITLPALNNSRSLAATSAIVVDGNAVALRLTAGASTSTSSSLTYVLNSNVPVNCSTLSTTIGTDFDAVGIRSIDSVTASNSNRTCTIAATSSVVGATGASTLSKASTFSIDDRQNPAVAVTTLVSGASSASTNVTVVTTTGLGAVNRNNLAGTARSVFNKTAPNGVFSALSNAAKNVLKNSDVLEAPAGVPGAEVEVDFSQAGSTRYDAKKAETISAGEKVQATIKIDQSLVATHEALAFFKSAVDSSNTTWAYLGKRDFDGSGLAATEPMVFAKRGTYYLKLIVVPKTSNFNFASVRSSVPTPAPTVFEVIRFGAAAYTDAQLPLGVQTLEVVVDVTGVEPTVNDPNAVPTSAPSSNSGGGSGGSGGSNPAPTTNPTPAPTVTPTPAPTVTPPPTVKPTVPVVTPKPAPKPSSPAAAEPVAPPAPPAQPAPPAPEQPVGPNESNEPNEPAPAESPSPSPTATAAEVDGAAAEVLEPFDPLGTPAAIEAAVDTAATAAVIAAAIAAAAAAAAAGGSRSSSSSSNAAAEGVEPNSADSAESGESSEGEIAELEVAQDNLQLNRGNWGDRLAIFAIPGMTIFDRLTHNLSLRVAPASPLLAKLINDGAYLRAILGSPIILASVASGMLGLSGAIANDGAMLTPAWPALLAIAILGIFDAAAGFTGASIFITASFIGAALNGTAVDVGHIRLMFGIMILAIGPAMLTTAFRTLRKHPADDFKSWWERLIDFAVAPFMAGWSSAAMVGALPALAGLTLPIADQVNTFALSLGAAAFVRVGLEEFAARYYPARLNRINPDELPEPPLAQRALSLAVKFAAWILLGGALVGESWQLWVGAALFLLPTVIGWYQDSFVNSPALWRILPNGVPGLALSLIVATLTTALMAELVGTIPALAAWSFVILPLPLLLLAVLGMFGRHGLEGEDEKPAQRNKWVYRIGGVIMLVVTLRLAGII